VVAEDFSSPGGGIGRGRYTEEGLHLAGWSEGDEHAAGIGVAAGKGVWNAAGADDRFAGQEFLAHVAHLKFNFALEDVEVLLLIEVIVEGRAAVDEVFVLDYEEAAVGFGWQGLEKHGAKAAGAMVAEPVEACANDVDLFGRLRVLGVWGGLGEREISKGGGGEDTGGRPETRGKKGASLHEDLQSKGKNGGDSSWHPAEFAN
jgi:hypothetical protein